MAWKLLFGSDVGLSGPPPILVAIDIGICIYLFLKINLAEYACAESRD